MTVVTTETSLLPTYFTPALINPAPGSLVSATTWVEEGGTPRWLTEGIAFLSAVVGNYSGDLSSGTWAGRFCSEPGSDLSSGQSDFKTGTRPDDGLPWAAETYWSYDACSLDAPSRAEVKQRAQQVLRMRWPNLAARDFITRVVADAGAPVAVSDLVEAVGELESVFADHNVLGVIHAAPKLLPALAHDLVIRSATSGVPRPVISLWSTAATPRSLATR